jgi:hypothetical protein
MLPIVGNLKFSSARGLSIFLALGAAYGLKRNYQLKKADKE